MDVTAIRRALRGVGRLLLVGALPGAVFFLVLFAASLLRPGGQDYMGVEDARLAGAIQDLFEDRIVRQQMGLAALAVGIGAAFGLAAAAWWSLVAALRRRPLPATAHAALSLGLVALAHGVVLVRSMAHYPSMYAPFYGGPGGSWPGSWLFALAVDGPPPVVWALAARVFGAVTVTLLAALALRRLRVPVSAPPRRLALRVALVGAAALTLVAALAWPRSAHPAGSAERPNVLLIAVDSLRGDLVGRADSVSATPHIDALARRGVLFRRAWSVVPRTFPSWVSILTGQYPHTHGVRHMFPSREERQPPRGSLAAELGDAGYRTAVVSDFAGDIFRRIDLGFARVDAPPFTLASNVALAGVKLHTHLLPYLVDGLEGAATPELGAFERLADPQWLTDRALDWVEGGAGADGGGPFFLTVFYSCGHFPFASPGPWWARYVDAGYRGRSRFFKEGLGHPLEGTAREAEETHVRGLYLGAVAASDAAIGRLLRELDRRGQLRNTIVVVTADHGENLFENGRGVSHGDHLYGLESLHVPLVVAGPGLPEAAVVDAPVRSVDIAPTLRRLLGRLPVAPEDGVDLAPWVRAAAIGGPAGGGPAGGGPAGGGPAGGGPALEALPVFAETGLWFVVPDTDRLEGRRIVYGEGFQSFRFEPDTYEIYVDPTWRDLIVAAKHRMLLDGDRKLLYVPTRSGVRWELYDPVGDPAERNDLAAAEPERLAAMKAKLRAWMLRDPNLERVDEYLLPIAHR